MVRFRKLVFLAGLMMVLSTALYGNDCSRSDRVGVKFKKNVATIEIDWGKTASDEVIMPACNIKDDMNVVVKVLGFNFVHFDLEVDVSTKTIVAYQVLNDLWKQLLTLPPESMFGAIRESLERKKKIRSYTKDKDKQRKMDDEIRSAEDFLARTGDWRELIRSENESLSKMMSEISADNPVWVGSAAIDKYLTEITKRINDLEAKRDKVWKGTIDVDTIDEAYKAHLLYDRYFETHNKLIEKIRSFVRSVTLSKEGKVFPVGKNKSGTLVNVAFEASAAKPGVVKEDEREIQYFVHSNLPLIFHVGMIVSVLEKLEFEKVEQFINEGMYGDYYQLVEEGNSDFDFSAFLSYEFHKSDDLRWGASVTFGTDLKDPGENLYFGLSGRFRKVLVTGGVAWNEVVRKDEKDKIPGIDLYRTITQERDAGWFIAFSFTLF